MAIHLPPNIDASTIAAIINHASFRWAAEHPHEAMQAHRECQVGQCLTKTIAYKKLVGDGKLVPAGWPA
ncbi:hypothetical protein IU501_23150 [Nocardia otitidiscaviarum]|uniref:hypothetical protein n=1 Tax=Nocardia otitidiscaviarum TaxID=1823 RepID=UPI0004A782AA|nr:hypothetical protein [Nocardia otitidiscaviarum]MBF6135893.1 hypothetical protein [Nocardia otitidiscaviarum]